MLKNKIGLKVWQYANVALRVYFDKVAFSWVGRINKKIKPALAAITCPKLTIETLEQGVKYVQS